MPLARIITTSAKYSDGLADDLRSRGFQVLTSAPGDSVPESADLEITLNECLPEDARAAADAPDMKDMRVFVTPQAFAGNIHSIEMFVLTPKRPSVQKLQSEELVEPILAESINATPASMGKVFEFAPPTDVVSADVSGAVDASPVDTSRDFTTAKVEVSSANPKESVQPVHDSAEEVSPVLETIHLDPLGVIGRAFLASRRAAVPEWPDMAGMKLVPAELAPASVKSAGVPLQAAILPKEISAFDSVRGQSPLHKRFWKAPIVAAIAASLALSAIWVVNRFSTSHSQAGTSFQQVAPSSVEAATPAPVGNPELAGTAPSSTSITQHKPAEKFAPTVATSRVRAPRPGAKRPKHNSDSGYVAKDTTVYFYNRPASLPGDQKPQARP